jgi:hypothetical protein
MIGTVSRYESLRDCRKQRTAIIKNLATWGPRLEDAAARASHVALVEVLRHRTWCWPAWYDGVRFDDAPRSAPDDVRSRWMRAIPENDRWLEEWRGKGAH